MDKHMKLVKKQESKYTNILFTFILPRYQIRVGQGKNLFSTHTALEKKKKKKKHKHLKPFVDQTQPKPNSYYDM